MTTLFKTGDKVRFTAKAKKRYSDDKYWLYSNHSVSPEDLDKVFTVKNMMFCRPVYILEGVPGGMFDVRLLESAESSL